MEHNKALIALVELFEQVAEESETNYSQLIESMKEGGW